MGKLKCQEYTITIAIATDMYKNEIQTILDGTVTEALEDEGIDVNHIEVTQD